MMAEPPWPTSPGSAPAHSVTTTRLANDSDSPIASSMTASACRSFSLRGASTATLGCVTQDAHELEPGHAGVTGEKRDAPQPLEPVERRSGGREAVDPGSGARDEAHPRQAVEPGKEAVCGGAIAHQREWLGHEDDLGTADSGGGRRALQGLDVAVDASAQTMLDDCDLHVPLPHSRQVSTYPHGLVARDLA